MTWTKLLVSRDVQRHRTSKKELDDIRALIARDLADAYTRSHVATETEAQEILEKATEFHGFVEAWIESNYSNLRR